MFAISRFLMDSMKSSWVPDIKKESIDNEIEHIFTAVCTSICIISVLPFATMYDIGYDLGSNCSQSTSVDIAEITPISPRRSARLAEKYARLKQV